MNEDLIRRIDALERWKADKERQQITYPLDIQSLNALDLYYMHITDELITVGGAGGLQTFDYLGSQGGGRNIGGSNASAGTQQFIVSKNVYFPYTVDVTTNFVTTAAYYEENQRINILTTDTAPAPLVPGVDYFAFNSTGTTFQLALVAGGPAIDITTTGLGVQFLYSFGF